MSATRTLLTLALRAVARLARAVLRAALHRANQARRARRTRRGPNPPPLGGRPRGRRRVARTITVIWCEPEPAAWAEWVPAVVRVPGE
jgi:hypothetical protein